MPVEVPAVAGACLAVRKKDFDFVGGFDAGYLAGQLEDSDLCIRLRARGGRVILLPDLKIVHLEQHSFAPRGTDEFEEKILLFNSWRYTQRWDQAIDKLAGERK